MINWRKAALSSLIRQIDAASGEKDGNQTARVFIIRLDDDNGDDGSE